MNQVQFNDNYENDKAYQIQSSYIPIKSYKSKPEKQLVKSQSPNTRIEVKEKVFESSSSSNQIQLQRPEILTKAGQSQNQSKFQGAKKSGAWIIPTNNSINEIIACPTCNETRNSDVQMMSHLRFQHPDLHAKIKKNIWENCERRFSSKLSDALLHLSKCVKQIATLQKKHFIAEKSKTDSTPDTNDAEAEVTYEPLKKEKIQPIKPIQQVCSICDRIYGSGKKLMDHVKKIHRDYYDKLRSDKWEKCKNNFDRTDNLMERLQHMAKCGISTEVHSQKATEENGGSQISGRTAASPILDPDLLMQNFSQSKDLRQEIDNKSEEWFKERNHESSETQTYGKDVFIVIRPSKKQEESNIPPFKVEQTDPKGSVTCPACILTCTSSRSLYFHVRDRHTDLYDQLLSSKCNYWGKDISGESIIPILYHLINCNKLKEGSIDNCYDCKIWNHSCECCRNLEEHLKKHHEALCVSLRKDKCEKCKQFQWEWPFYERYTHFIGCQWQLKPLEGSLNSDPLNNIRKNQQQIHSWEFWGKQFEIMEEMQGHIKSFHLEDFNIKKEAQGENFLIPVDIIDIDL